MQGIVIGGDHYPVSISIDYLPRYDAISDYKVLVLLGQANRVQEYHVIEAIKTGKICKQIVVWAIRTCTKIFTNEEQFGQADSVAKDAATKAAGMLRLVAATFEDLLLSCAWRTNRLFRLEPSSRKPELEPPAFQLLYADMPISSIFKDETGLGDVVSLLWFRCRLPSWATEFIATVLMLTTDHVPAVSG